MVAPAVPQVGDVRPKFARPGDKVSLFAAVDANGGQTKFEAIQSVSFLQDPNGVGPERRIVLEKGRFSVSGDRLGTTCACPTSPSPASCVWSTRAAPARSGPTA